MYFFNIRNASIVGAAVVFLAIAVMFYSNIPTTITMNELDKLVDNGLNVTEIVRDYHLKKAYFYSENETYKVWLPDSVNITRFDSVKTTYITNIGFFTYILDTIVYFGIIACIFIAAGSISSSMTTDKLNSGDWFNIIKNENIKVSFNDVIGQKDAKKDLETCISFLKKNQLYKMSGAKTPKGLLFTGPPGCGKTMLAKAFAKEAGVTFISACGSNFSEIYIGSGSQRVRKLFEVARKNKPAVLFIDEIDALGSRNSKAEHGHNEDSKTLNA